MQKIIVLIVGVLILFGIANLQTQSTVLVVTKSGNDGQVKGKISVPTGAYLYRISEPSTVSYVSLKKFFEKPEQYVTGISTSIIGDGWFSPTDSSGYISAYTDINTFVTDSEKRDKDLVEIFSDTNIRFSASLENIGLVPNEGFTLEIPGQLTINGITHDVTFLVSGIVTETEVIANGSTKVKISDFNLEPPSLINIFTVDDELELKFDIKAERLN